MDARELDILEAEAQAEVDALWEEFVREWEGQRGNQEPAEEVNGA